MNFKDIIFSRRAVNFFDPKKEVSDSLLTEMIEMAAQTPSGFNHQPWSLIVLKEHEDKLRLQKHAWNQTKISEQEQQITKLGLQIKEANEAKDTIRKEMDTKMKE